MTSDPQLFSDLFKNNAATPDGPDRTRGRTSSTQTTRVDGVYDYMMFMGE